MSKFNVGDRIYTHAELVQKLEEAQMEIRRLRVTPDQFTVVSNLTARIMELENQVATLAEERNDLAKRLTWWHDNATINSN